MRKRRAPRRWRDIPSLLAAAREPLGLRRVGSMPDLSVGGGFYPSVCWSLVIEDQLYVLSEKSITGNAMGSFTPTGNLSYL